MKPPLLQLGLATSLLLAPQLLRAQTKSSPPELLATAPGWTEGNHAWGTLPPPKPLPYGYVWGEYRGADIEHPLYAPRHSGQLHRAACGPCVVTQFCCWFDKLFTRKCSTAAARGCEGHGCEGHIATDLPPLPTLAPEPTRVLPTDNTPVELTPFPVPTPPVASSPATLPDREPTPHLSPLDPAPIMPPVDLIPTRPLVTSDPPAEPAPIEPGPIVTAPIEPAPIVTAPIDPALIQTTPSEPRPAEAAPIPDRKPIASERTPVIELAPDFAVPGQPMPIAPPPTAGSPGAIVPRNIIPSRIVPQNQIPALTP